MFFNLVKEGNRILDKGSLSTETKGQLEGLFVDLKKMAGILGILQLPWKAFFDARTDRQLQGIALSPSAIDALVAERTAARKNKDWQRADEIRDSLAEEGIVLEDKADGTHWKATTQ